MRATHSRAPNRPYDGSWDCDYWRIANGIDDIEPFNKAWNDPATELRLPVGAIVRKIEDSANGRRIEWWYQWDSPKEPAPLRRVTVEEVT